MSERSYNLSSLLVGCCFQKPDLLGDLLRSVQPSDLDGPYGPTLTTLVRMSKDGPVDALSLQHAVAAVYPHLPHYFAADLAVTGLPVAFDMYLSEFREGLARRKLANTATVIDQAARMDDLRMGIERVEAAVRDAEAMLSPRPLALLDGTTVPGYEAPADSILLPGLMWRQSRMIITGYEGQGKSVLLRQLAMAPALGIHPFNTTGRIPPIRTLLIDLENPPAVARTVMRSMFDTLRDRGVAPDDLTDFGERFKFLIAPEGMDIVGSGADRQRLTQAVKQQMPDLLCIGPMYRLAAAGGNLDEAQAGSVADYLNTLRTSYDMAVVTEAHAAKGATNDTDHNTHRGLAPSGSGVWLRFPEVGRGLRYDPKASQRLDRRIFEFVAWRGDRAPRIHFPHHLGKCRGESIWWDDVSEEVECLT